MKNIIEKDASSSKTITRRSSVAREGKGVYGYWTVQSCPTGELEDVFVMQDPNEYEIKYSCEIAEIFRGNMDVYYFYTRIGHATNWTGRLTKKQSTARGLAELTGFNHKTCNNMKARLLKCGFAYIDNNGMMCFKTIQDHRSHKDYLNIKLNTKQSIKEGQKELEKRYVTKRIRAQERAVEYNGTTITDKMVSQQSSDNKKSTIRLSNKTLAIWLGCTKMNASYFKHNVLTDFNFARDIKTFGQPSKAEIKRLMETNKRGAWILSEQGYLKWEGAHIVSRKAKPRKEVGMVSLFNNNSGKHSISQFKLSDEEMSYLFEPIRCISSSKSIVVIEGKKTVTR